MGQPLPLESVHHWRYPDRPIAEALLDQRVLAGIGNVYCNELCFVSG
ncbi:hypothetical protein DSK20_04040, partial [Mycobacterium tuberculosis]